MNHQPRYEWTRGRLVARPCPCEEHERPGLLLSLIVLVVSGGLGIWLIVSACQP